MADFKVTVRQIDPDYEEDASPHDVILRIEDRSFCIVGGGRWIPFRGPFPLQCLLTPICALRGILTSRRDLTWIDDEDHLPRLMVTPCVPADFMVEFAFTSRADADSARNLIARIWR